MTLWLFAIVFDFFFFCRSKAQNVNVARVTPLPDGFLGPTAKRKPQNSKIFALLVGQFGGPLPAVYFAPKAMGRKNPEAARILLLAREGRPQKIALTLMTPFYPKQGELLDGFEIPAVATAVIFFSKPITACQADPTE